MIERLISFAVLLQTFEFFFIPAWPWALMEKEFPRLLKPVLARYRALLSLRFIAAILVLLRPHWAGLALELVTTVLIAWRWRGSFNGGSDCMTFQILLASLVATLRPELNVGCLFYIAIQLTLSYFVAGIAKVRTREWRAGTALPRFLQSPRARMPLLSGIAIAFECLFPLSLLGPQFALPLLVLGVGFHLLNFYFFGLNRFFFVWLSGYPAIFFTSLYLGRSS